MADLTQNTGSTALSFDNNPALAAFVLRVASGGLFLVHGLTKLFVFTPAGTAGYFQSIGLPGFLGIATMALEILGGIALVLGFGVRWLSILFTFVLLGAAWFGHAANGFGFGNPGGGWEFPVYWAVVMAALALLGNGTWSIANRR